MTSLEQDERHEHHEYRYEWSSPAKSESFVEHSSSPVPSKNNKGRHAPHPSPILRPSSFDCVPSNTSQSQLQTHLQTQLQSQSQLQTHLDRHSSNTSDPQICRKRKTPFHDTPICTTHSDSDLMMSTVTTTTTSTTTTATTAAATTDSHIDSHCLVCYTDLTYRTLTPCDHNEICATCHLRLRHLHKDRKCPICKAPHEQVIVDKNTDSTDNNNNNNDQKRVFEDYPIWGNELGAGFMYREDVGMFFPTDYYESEIRTLFGYHCTLPNCHYDGPESTKLSAGDQEAVAPNQQQKQKHQTNPFRALQDHLRVKHRLQLCTLCVDHQRDFVSRLPRWTPTQLKQHLTKGDGPLTGFEGHPLCEFCKPKRFYDITALHQHLLKDHYKCHVCQQTGLENQFFNNYRSLERHFDQRHFMCHDVQCLTARFVVFANELDLRHHERQVHGGTSTGSTKIQLEFRVRRANGNGDSPRNGPEPAPPSETEFNYGLDGQAFVPAALPTTTANNNLNSDTVTNSNANGNGNSNASSTVLHPLHVQRTEELRRQAAMIRQEQGLTSASSGNNNNNNNSNNNNNGNGGEYFPALGADEAATTLTASGGPPLRLGWAAGTTMERVGRRQDAGVVTEEAFPSLPVNNNNKKKKSALSRLQHNNQNNNNHNPQQSQAQFPPLSNNLSNIVASVASAPRVVTPTPVHPNNNNNSANNLAAANFPSLGGTTGGSAAAAAATRPRYAAAEALAKKHQQSKAKPNTPTWSSSDFPAPPSASSTLASTSAPSVRQRLLGDSRQLSNPYTRAANVLQGPTTTTAAAANTRTSTMPAMTSPSMDSTITINDMKVILGSTKYKQLKALTREFAESNATASTSTSTSSTGLAPDAFVDHAASLFERGYADEYFWKFVPTLIRSTPASPLQVQAALSYMTNLHRMRNGALNAEANHSKQQQIQQQQQQQIQARQSTVKTTSGGSWSQTSPAVSRPGGVAVASLRQPQPTAATATAATMARTMPRTVPGKTKVAWGGAGGTGGINASVLRAKAPPGSVAIAASQQTPSTGSATKFMAKERKQQQQQQQSANSKKKKKKQNNELKQLAFG